MNKLLIRKNKKNLSKPKNAKRNAAPRSRRPRRTSPRLGNQVMLSACASHYAKAIAEPWSPEAMGACVPKVPARPSRKVTGFTRQTVYAGTSGYGFVAVMPCTANNNACILVSTATFAGNSTEGVEIGATGTAWYALSNLPVPQSAFDKTTASLGTPTAAARIVSAGLSIQYTGALVNQGGYYRAYTDPSHNNLLGTDSGAALNNSAETAFLPITPKKRNFAISAVDTVEYEYASNDDAWDIYPYSNRQSLTALSPTVGGAPFLLEFVSTPGNAFFIEYIQHVEYTGAAFQGALTPSHADATGFETVAAASAAIPGLRKASPETPMGKLMDMALKATVATLKPIAYKALSKGHAYLMDTSL